MTQEIIVRDQFGEMYKAELEIYRTVANPFSIGMRIMRQNHLDAATMKETTKRPWVHITLDNEGIRALLRELETVI